mgnify:CR=1 FL=1
MCYSKIIAHETKFCYLIFQKNPRQSGVEHFLHIINYMTYFHTSKLFYASFNPVGKRDHIIGPLANNFILFSTNQDARKCMENMHIQKAFMPSIIPYITILNTTDDTSIVICNHSQKNFVCYDFSLN